MKLIGTAVIVASFLFSTGLIEKTPLGEVVVAHHDHGEPGAAHHHGDADDHHESPDDPCHHHAQHCCCTHAHALAAPDLIGAGDAGSTELGALAQDRLRTDPAADALLHVPRS